MKNERGKKIIAILLFILATILFYTFRPKGQGELTFKVYMDKNNAVNKAKNLALKYHWPIENSTQAAAFSLDEKAQTYFELEVGNYKQLNALIQKEKGYIPAIWTSSIIHENKKEKVDIFFTPSGKNYGFIVKVPESEKGPALDVKNAQKLAENEAFKNWNVNFDEYRLVGTGKKNQVNGRVDYTFDYERNKNIGAAKDKVELQVSGDKLTKVQHYLDIPETFSRKYEERRSSNNTIANVSFITFYILIFIVGLFCFFYLTKRRMILWKKALILSIFIVFISLISGITELKQTLINLDTTLYTKQLFYIITMVTVLLTALITAILTFASMMIGEGLSRKAFPKHPHFWRMMSFKNFGSWQFLDRVIIAYIFVICMLIYETLFYGTMNHFPGWWQPASMISDPNISTSWFAWIKGFGEALNAGFFEEFAFRALLISLGVIIGDKFNKRRLGITLAFIFQILMFSAGHANYPGFPAYARLVELLLVAFGFGLMFYFCGIIPGIIAHFTYDFILMNMYIITTSGKALIYQKILIAVIVLLPILLAFYGRVKNGCWNDLKDDSFNYSDQGIEILKNKEVESICKNDMAYDDKNSFNLYFGKNKKLAIYILTSVFLAAAIWELFSIHQVISPINIGKMEAESIAKKELQRNGFNLSDDWKVISDTETQNLEGKDILNGNEGFSDENFIGFEGEKSYKLLLGGYINPIKWHVRFIRVKGNIDERAEEFNVYITGRNGVVNVQHIVPKNKAGENLSKEKAKEILVKAVNSKYGIDFNNLKEISSDEIKLSRRTDWSFALEDDSIKLRIYKPEIRAVVSENEILVMERTLRLPEGIKGELFKKDVYKVLLGALLLLPLVLIVIVTSVKAIIAWTKADLSKKIFIRIFMILLILNFAAIPLNISTIEMGFSTAEPLNSQLIITSALSLIGKIILIFIESSIIAYTNSFYKRFIHKDQIYIVLAILAAILIFVVSVIFIRRPILNFHSSIKYSLGSYNNYISQIVTIVNSFIGELVIFLSISSFLKRLKKWYNEIIMAILLFYPLCLAALDNAYYPWRYLAAAIICLVYILAYYFLFKIDITLVPIAVGTGLVLINLLTVALNQYQIINLSIVTAIFTLILLIFYFYGLLNKKF